MSSGFNRYTRDEFLGEFFPNAEDKAMIAAGMEQLRAEQRACRLAEMRRRLGVTQAEAVQHMGVTQGASPRSSSFEPCLKDRAEEEPGDEQLHQMGPRRLR